MQLAGVEPATFGSVDQTAIAISLRKSHLRFPQFTQIATNYTGMVRVWYTDQLSNLTGMLTGGVGSSGIYSRAAQGIAATINSATGAPGE